MVCRPCPSTLDKSLQGGQPVTVKRFAADMSPALCDMQRRTLDNLHQRPSVAGLQVSPSGKIRYWILFFGGTSFFGVPSGKVTFCYGKSPFSMGKLTINGYFQ